MSAWIGRRRPLSIAVAVLVGVAIAAAVVVAGLYGRAPRATRVHVGEVAPDFELPVLDGDHPVRLSGNRGGPSLLLFFDTRWPGSDEYLKYVERMHRRYFRRGLRTTAVALDNDPNIVRDFVRRNSLTFAVVSDPFAAKLHPTWGTPKDPEAYLIDPEGRVEVVLLERVDWTTPKVRDFLSRYLKEGPLGY